MRWISPKNHSTETTFLSLHDHLFNAIVHQQVSCLCLLDLSAAFDTLDYSILLIRLSTWFCISSISLSWFRSYLSSRSSYVSVVGTPSNITISCRVPQGSVLWHSFQSLYHSHLHSNSKCLSFIPSLRRWQSTFLSIFSKDFPLVINQLKSAVATISSWMTTNLLTFNPSKTEFMLIGLP